MPVGAAADFVERNRQRPGFEVGLDQRPDPSVVVFEQRLLALVEPPVAQFLLHLRASLRPAGGDVVESLVVLVPRHGSGAHGVVPDHAEEHPPAVLQHGHRLRVGDGHDVDVNLLVATLGDAVGDVFAVSGWQEPAHRLRGCGLVAVSLLVRRPLVGIDEDDALALRRLPDEELAVVVVRLFDRLEVPAVSHLDGPIARNLGEVPHLRPDPVARRRVQHGVGVLVLRVGPPPDRLVVGLQPAIRVGNLRSVERFGDDLSSRRGRLGALFGIGGHEASD